MPEPTPSNQPNPFEILIQALLGQARQRPDLAAPLGRPTPGGPVATFAGRMIKEGATARQTLAEFPMGGAPGEEGLVAPAVSGLGVGGSAGAFGAMVRRLGPSAIKTPPKIYLTMGDLRKAKGWGSEWWWEHKDRPGAVIHGTPTLPRDLPPVIYHVSGRVSEIERSGILRATHHASSEGGLGGGAGPAAAVYFTADRNIARIIKHDLLHAFDIAKGKLTGLEALEKIMTEDAKKFGVSLERLREAAKASGTIQFYEGNVAHPVYKGNERNLRNLTLDTYKSYLRAREDATGITNPLLFGDVESFAKIDPKGLGIIGVRSAAIPEGALVRRNPLNQSKDAMAEIAVHADIPIGGMKVVTE